MNKNSLIKNLRSRSDSKTKSEVSTELIEKVNIDSKNSNFNSNSYTSSLNYIDDNEDDENDNFLNDYKESFLDDEHPICNLIADGIETNNHINKNHNSNNNNNNNETFKHNEASNPNKTDKYLKNSSSEKDFASKMLSNKPNSKRVILNVGGTRHEVMWRTLEKLPNSRLGKIRYASKIEDIKELCDDISPKDNEIFFDRHSSSFSSVLNFYRTGKLHLVDDICILSFHEDLYYWGVEECFLESCCHLKYHQRKEAVLEEIKKEEEAEREHIMEENFNSCCPVIRKKIWDLMENPQTSKAARVSARIFSFELFFFANCF